MKNLDLLLFGGKKAGDPFSAEDWNSFVKNVAELASPELKTGKIEQRVFSEGAYGDWTDITSSVTNNQLAAGGVYRLSGYFTKAISITGEGAATKIYLNGCFINSDTGSCIKYNPDNSRLTVIVNPNTENYLIQTSEGTGDEYRKIGAIHSENNLTITGAGLIYIDNVKGHGIRGSELELRGDNTIIVKASHDAFHGSQVLDVYNGNYYVLDCNDAFGTGTRGTGEETKLRGILRVFGGNFHVYKLGNGQYVFDAQYQKMQYDESNDIYYSEDDDTTGVTITQIYNSGFHTLKYIVDGPAVNSNNIANNFAYNIVRTGGTVSVGGEPVSAVDGVYTISNASSQIFVRGVIMGTIVVSATKCEIHLDRAVLVAPETGDNAGIAIKYTIDDKNIQIQSEKGSEDNYIFGGIQSVKNIKFTPKKDSVLHIYPDFSKFYGEGIAISGSNIVFNNGNGSIYISKANIGILGTEIWIGNDDSVNTPEDQNKRKDPLEGDLYILDNNVDIVARLNSTGDKKGFMHISFDFKGNAFAESIITNYSYRLSGGESGIIVGETGIEDNAIVSNPAVVREAGKLYYKKNLGIAKVLKDAAVRYSAIDGDKFINKLN